MIAHGAAVGGSLVHVLDEAESAIHSDPATAEKLLDTVRIDATAQGLPGLAGRASYLHARVLAERGDYEAALGRIIEARDAFAAAGQDLMAARTSLGRMHILDDLGRYAEALHVGEALLQRLANVAPVDAEETDLKAMVEAAALGNCGIALGFLGQHARSLDAYERAEQAYAALGMTDDAAMWQANRGIELISLGQAHRAVEVLADAAVTYGQTGDQLWQAKCWTYLAEASRLTGDVVRALALLADAQHDLEALGADAELVRVHLQRGWVYLDAGLGREATAAARAAADIAGTAGMADDGAHAHLIAARVALAADNIVEGEADLAAAEELFRLTGNVQFQARTRATRAELLARRGDRRAAADLLEETIEQLKAGGWLIPAGWGLLTAYDLADPGDNRARLLNDAGQLAHELSVPDLEVAVQHRQARQLSVQGDRDAAADELRQARSRIAQLGSAYHEPSLMTAFHASKRAISDDLVELLVTTGNSAAIEEALSVSDDAKAQTLSDLVAGTLGGRANSADATSAAVDRMRAELSGIYAALQDADASRREVLRGRADELEAAIVDAHVRWSVSGRDAHVAAETVGRPVSADRAPGLAFHVVGDDIVAFVVAGEQVHARVLDGAYPQVRRFTTSLTSQWTRMQMAAQGPPRLHAQLARTAEAVLADLYAVLLAPLTAELDALTGEHLVIAPDRLLHQVPFHALFDGQRYLIDRWAITLAPTTRPRRTTSGDGRASGGFAGRSVVVGVPDARAPHIGMEARRVADALTDAELLIGEDATVEAVATALSGASLVHLACHGMYRSENALFSSVRLADRWWTCSEVLDLDLSGATVVLTACESGRSGDTAEPIGLAWGFLATGATSAVVSQWVLDDQASTELMDTFYQRLNAGDDVAIALRAAQLTVRTEREHPYFWGPLVHVASPFDNTNMAFLGSTKDMGR